MSSNPTDPKEDLASRKQRDGTTGTLTNGRPMRPPPAHEGPPPERPDPLPTVNLAGIEPERVRWLWAARIPMGKLTLIEGDPGTGKSTVAFDIAARVTRGDLMPGEIDVSGIVGPDAAERDPRRVLILAAEDGIADTIVPRLIEAGADMSRVEVVKALADGGEPVSFPQHVGNLAESIRRLADVALVIVDPVMAFVGAGLDTHKDADSRQMLTRLKELADQTGVALLGVRHLNKSGGGKAVYRGGGSIAFTATARCVLTVGTDPSDASGTTRVLAVAKSNLAAFPKSLTFALVSDGPGPARVDWRGETDATADSLMIDPDPERETALGETTDFLRVVLADGRVPQQEVLRQARECGYSRRTLERAKQALGVKSERVAQPKPHWEWSLPIAGGYADSDADPSEPEIPTDADSTEDPTPEVA